MPTLDIGSNSTEVIPALRQIASRVAQDLTSSCYNCNHLVRPQSTLSSAFTCYVKEKRASVSLSDICVSASANHINMEDLSDPPTDINPYEVLEIETSATSSDVKSAYKKLALRYHPGLFRKHGQKVQRL